MGRYLMLSFVIFLFIIPIFIGTFVYMHLHEKNNLFNIYHFGDSYSDPGNIPFMITKDGKLIINKSFDTLLNPTNITLKFRVNTRSINTDGDTFPLFLCRLMGFRLFQGFDNNLTINYIEKGKYMNFAISGAGQRFNTGTKTRYGSFPHQIDRFYELINNNTSENDIFIYHDVGGNDMIQIMFNIMATGIQSNVDIKIEEFTNTTISNIYRLYNAGMRKLCIVFGNVDVSKVPFFVKIAKFMTQKFPESFKNFDTAIDFMREILLKMQKSFSNKINEYQLTKIKLSYFKIIYSRDYMEPIIGNNLNELDWPVSQNIPPKNSNNSIYVDDIHYSEFANIKIAKYIYNIISKN